MSFQNQTADLKKDHKRLVTWYQQNKRDLPWRQSQDPYKIWLSEVMLQQTTVVAVIPYFQKFTKLFPSVQKLAQAPLEEVLEAWSGLGYYSRARNLHKAAQELAQKGFPKTAEELLKYPGFGPYTSRAVASIAFNEAVGVLDGNVIRVLSRKYGFNSPWWDQKGKNLLQSRADELARLGDSSSVNQGLMELGATICTPQKTLCALCPWSKDCVAFQTGQVQELPLAKPRRAFENWQWEVQLIRNSKGEYALCENNYLPFLKGQLIFPGLAKKVSKKPERFQIQHGITHHKIYIQVQTAKANHKLTQYLWLRPEELKKKNPSIVLQKILRSAE